VLRARSGNTAASTPRRCARPRSKPTFRPGGTLQGYGVKFYPPGSQLAGQNERAFPVVTQYIAGRAYIAWPRAIQTSDPVLPFPKGHAFAP